MTIEIAAILAQVLSAPTVPAFGHIACVTLLWRHTPRRMLAYRTRLTSDETEALGDGDDADLPECAKLVEGSTVRCAALEGRMLPGHTRRTCFLAFVTT
jgi:hypothetical protein